VLAQDLFDDGLRHLLAWLGKPAVPAGGETEGVVEIGDPAAGQ